MYNYKMDKKSVNALEELNSINLKINSFFQDLISERDQYKSSSEDSIQLVKQLKIIINKLEEDNKKLLEKNTDLEYKIIKCFKILRSLDLPHNELSKSYQEILEELLSSYSYISENSEHLPLTQINVTNSFTTKIKQENHEEEILKKEIESIGKLNLSTQFFTDIDIDENLTKNDIITSEFVLEKHFKKDCQNKYNNELIHDQEFLSTDADKATKPVINETKIFPEQKTPEKSCMVEASPVFKGLGVNKKLDSSPNEVNRLKTLKLVNEEFLLKKSNVVTTPIKRTSGQFSSPSPKRKNSKVKQPESPKFSGLRLKKSNSREVEISPTGVRKLVQTTINFQSLKNNKDDSIGSNEVPDKKLEEKKETEDDPSKYLGIGEEDDVIIMESPKFSDSLDDDCRFKNKKKNILLEAKYITPPVNLDPDLDETYVSSSLVKKCSLTENQVLKKIDENHTPIKRSGREGSPEYAYKREPIRKKAERMKLPGHACFDCINYYKERLREDNKDGQDLKEILNKCSRHRDVNPPSADDTPPGYWKPYLTATAEISPNKNTTIMENKH